MPQILLTTDQRAQLGGFLNREKDFLMSISAMADRIVTPGVTGTIELIRNDYEFVERLRKSLRNVRSGNPALAEIVYLSEADLDTLANIDASNKFADRAPFWRSITEAVEKATPSGQLVPNTVEEIVE